MAESQPMAGFVASALAKGMSKTELRQVLLRGGWPKEVVDGYLGRVVPAEPVVRSVILRVKGLQKKGASGIVLENINLEIAKGEIFGIVGPGGSGKSTLMHLLVGLDQPDAGDVQIISNNIPRSVFRDETTRELMGFSPQLPSVYDDMTCRENIMNFAALFGLSETAQKNAAVALLRLVKLEKEAGRLARNLSTGQRKRLDIACAIVHNPPLLLLDDPAGELDSTQQQELWQLLRQIADKGTTIIIASNFLGDLEALCDRIGILRNGRISEIGKPDDLRAIYSHDFEIRLSTEKALYAQITTTLAADGQSAAKKITKEGNHLLIQTPNPPATLRSLLAAIDKQDDSILSVQVMRPTIQEVFEALSSR